MNTHLPLKMLTLWLLVELFVVILHGTSGAVGGEIIQDDFLSYDIIDTLLVVDSLAENLKDRIRQRDIGSNPVCLYQDVYKHTVSTEPSVNIYGPFSAQLSVNGLRPSDMSSRVDNVLTLYKKDSYHNLFSLPRCDIFKTNLNKHGFPTFDLITDPKEGHGVSLGLLDFSAFGNLYVSGVSCFNLVRVSWLDQIMGRLYDEKYSIFPSFEEYYFKIKSDAPGDLGHALNFWFVDQNSYFETNEFDDAIDEGTDAYHTSARWKSNSRSMAGWYTYHLLVKDSYIRSGFSFSYTRRRDYAGGKSGLRSEEPTELNSQLDFLTLDASAVLDCYTSVEGLEIEHGIRGGEIVNEMNVDNKGMYYPAIYMLQRGDEYTPDRLMHIAERSRAFGYETWLRIRREFLGLGIKLGITGQHRLNYPYVWSPEAELDHVSSWGRFLLVIGRRQRFPGVERAHVTMYPLGGKRVEKNDSVTLSFDASWLSLSGYYARLYDLFDPVDENSMFNGDYAEGYSTGLEMILRPSLWMFDFHLGYGLGRSILTREGVSYPSTYDLGEKATGQLMCRICDHLSFSVAGDCSRGQRITPLVGREATESGYRPVWGPPNSARLPLNWGISFGATIKFTHSFGTSLYITDLPGRKFAVVYDDWHTKNYVMTHWYGGLKAEYEF